MTEKSTTVTKPAAPVPAKVEAPKVQKVGTNALAIKWPQDQYGITSMLKKEGVRTIGRVNGDGDKLDVFIATMRVLVQHAKEKFEYQNDVKANKLGKLAARERAEAKVSEAGRLKKLAQLQREIERLKALAPTA